MRLYDSVGIDEGLCFSVPSLVIDDRDPLVPITGLVDDVTHALIW
jgi:hypothetical protein